MFRHVIDYSSQSYQNSSTSFLIDFELSSSIDIFADENVDNSEKRKERLNQSLQNNNFEIFSSSNLNNFGSNYTDKVDYAAESCLLSESSNIHQDDNSFEKINFSSKKNKTYSTFHNGNLDGDMINPFFDNNCSKMDSFVNSEKGNEEILSPPFSTVETQTNNQKQVLLTKETFNLECFKKTLSIQAYISVYFESLVFDSVLKGYFKLLEEIEFTVEDIQECTVESLSKSIQNLSDLEVTASNVIARKLKKYFN